MMKSVLNLSVALMVFFTTTYTSEVKGQTSATSRRINVLFIAADDLNTNLGTYGHSIVKSPNIDRLARRGVRFDRAYAQVPLCNPSRASLLSGFRPETTGILGNDIAPRQAMKDTIFLPQLFKNHGYFAAGIGKIFHYVFDDKPSWTISEAGTTRLDGDLGGYLRAKSDDLPPGVVRAPAQAGQSLFWKAEDAPDEAFGDGMIARRVAALMEQSVKDGKPFFIGAGFRKPHLSWNVPKKYFDLYDPEKITWPKETPDHLANIPAIARRNATTIAPLPDEQRREAMRAYYASISFMDAQVGVLLDALDRLKLWDSTVVVFFGDHGFQLGEHGGLYQKMVLFEESARTPLIVASPKVKGSIASSRLVELVDLYPTITELTGLPTPSGMEGTSFVPLLKEPNRAWKKAAFVTVSRSNPKSVGRSVHTERYRYTEWGDETTAELYDHKTDLHEQRNLSRDPKQRQTITELQRLLQAGWRAAVPKSAEK